MAARTAVLVDELVQAFTGFSPDVRALAPLTTFRIYADAGGRTTQGHSKHAENLHCEAYVLTVLVVLTNSLSKIA